MYKQNKIFQEELKIILSDLGINLKQLAEMADLSPSAIKLFKNGTCSYDTKKKVLAAINEMRSIKNREPLLEKEFYKNFETAQSEKEKTEKIELRKKAEKYKIEKSRFAKPNALADFVYKYYFDGVKNSGDVKLYAYRYGNGPIKYTSIVTKGEWLDLEVDLMDDDKAVCKDADDDKFIPLNVEDNRPLLNKYAKDIIKLHNASGVEMVDNTMYAILSVNCGESDKKSINFSYIYTTYCTYRYTSGLITDELSRYLIEKEGIVPKFDEASRVACGCRHAVMPDIESIVSFNKRYICGGTGVVLAIKKPKTQKYKEGYYNIYLQRRSGKVGDHDQQYTVLPLGYHQPETPDHRELKLRNTVFRETWEEVFGYGVKDYKKAKNIRKGELVHYDWYKNWADELLRTGEQNQRDEARAFLWFFDPKNSEKFTMELLSFGIAADSGNCEYGVLLVVHDEEYSRIFPEALNPYWERDHKIRCINTMDNDKSIEMFLNDENRGATMTNESRVHLIEAINRLKKIAPNCVRMPSIQRIMTDKIL